MSQAYIGQLKMFAGNFAPQGWLFCEGQTLPVADYYPLFQLIGTKYGGDGMMTFALPDLRGRLPVHQGNGHTLGESGGTAGVILTSAQMPSHTHAAQAYSGQANQRSPAGHVWAHDAMNADAVYSDHAPDVTMRAGILSSAGGGQPHSNMQPYLPIRFIIAISGIYPSQF
jgi:microcystin-dependent protein